MDEITIEKEENEVVSEVVEKIPDMTIAEEQQAKDLYTEFSLRAKRRNHSR